MCLFTRIYFLPRHYFSLFTFSLLFCFFFSTFFLYYFRRCVFCTLQISFFSFKPFVVLFCNSHFSILCVSSTSIHCLSSNLFNKKIKRTNKMNILNNNKIIRKTIPISSCDKNDCNCEHALENNIYSNLSIFEQKKFYRMQCSLHLIKL